MPKNKEKLFTDQMGKNVYVFPPYWEGNTGLSSFADKKKNQERKEGIYTGIPFVHIRGIRKMNLNY